MDVEAEPPDGVYDGKAYRSPGVTVYFNARRCRHFAECIHGLPSVFDVQARPWIQPAAAAPEDVAEVVRRCPSGALHYVLASGEPEEGVVPTTVTPLPDGPLLLRGSLRVQLSLDEVTWTHETRMAACACGRTANVPFCDGACHAAAEAE